MQLTHFLMTVAVIVLAIYDLIIVSVGGVDWSVSRWVQNIGFDAPYLILTIGFLLGHWFGYMPPKRLIIKVTHSRGVTLVRSGGLLNVWQLNKLGIDTTRPYYQEIVESKQI